MKYLQPILIAVLFISVILLSNVLNNLSAKLDKTNILTEQINSYLNGGVQVGVFPNGTQITQRLQELQK